MGRPAGRKAAKPKKVSDDEAEGSDAEVQAVEDVADAEDDQVIDFAKDKGVSPKFFVIPEDINRAGWENIDLISITHPRTGNPALFFVDSRKSGVDEAEPPSSFLYEILTFEQATRSWFVGDSVASDGNLHVVTPFDPLFLILPVMSKSTRAQPLADHLHDILPHTVVDTICRKMTSTDLTQISIKKEAGDIIAYLFDETIAMQWLKRKVDIVAKYFEKKDITRMESSISSNFTLSSVSAVSKDPQEYLTYACDLVGENLDPERKKKLLEYLGLPSESDRKRKTEEEESAKSNKKVKVDSGDGIVQPLEDYSGEVSAAGTPTNTPKGAKAKQLLKAAQGSQSLFKFFSPKQK